MGMFFADNPVTNFEQADRADHKLFASFFRAMLRRGVWLPPSGYEAMFVSSVHDDSVIGRVLAAADESFAEIAS